MTKAILLTYASKYGATTEIAQRMQKELQQTGFEVTALPANQVKDLSPYQAVILGSALYMGQWRKEAVQLLKKYQNALSQKEFWIFTSGPTGKGDPKELVQGRLMPDNLKPIIEICNPNEVVVFGGKTDIEKMNGFEKWIVKKVHGEFGDFRDWQTISAWTANIRAALKKAYENLDEREKNFGIYWIDHRGDHWVDHREFDDAVARLHPRGGAG